MSLIVLALIATATQTPDPARTPAADKPICRRELPIGSYLPVRTCHTKAQWAQIDEANGRAASDARRANDARSGTIPNR